MFCRFWHPRSEDYIHFDFDKVKAKSCLTLVPVEREKFIILWKNLILHLNEWQSAVCCIKMFISGCDAETWRSGIWREWFRELNNFSRKVFGSKRKFQEKIFWCFFKNPFKIQGEIVWNGFLLSIIGYGFKSLKLKLEIVRFCVSLARK